MSAPAWHVSEAEFVQASRACCCSLSSSLRSDVEATINMSIGRDLLAFGFDGCQTRLQALAEAAREVELLSVEDLIEYNR